VMSILSSGGEETTRPKSTRPQQAKKRMSAAAMGADNFAEGQPISWKEWFQGRSEEILATAQRGGEGPSQSYINDNLKKEKEGLRPFAQIVQVVDVPTRTRKWKEGGKNGSLNGANKILRSFKKKKGRDRCSRGSAPEGFRFAHK